MEFGDTTFILIAILLVWLGIFGYLWSLDRKLTRLSRQSRHPAESRRSGFVDSTGEMS